LLRHIFTALALLRKPLSGQQKRRLARTLNAIPQGMKKYTLKRIGMILIIKIFKIINIFKQKIVKNST